MKTIKLNSSNLDQVINTTISILKSDGLAIFPSDTVYGLLCDATNEEAVKKLIAFKNRPAGKPISVFCNFKIMEDLVEIDESQLRTIKQIIPGPFTIILPSKHKVNKLLESEKGSLGIRIPMYRYIEVLIDKFEKPITATSANIAGRPAHYSVATLLKELSSKQKELIDLVVDVGILPRNKPSTVVDLTEPDIKIIRQGDEEFSNKSKIYYSKTTDETKEIAKQIFKNVKIGNKPLIFIIEGEMGVGKTIFVKGIGEIFGINNIISPTYVIYYEYKNFYHFDLFNIENKDEFKYLGLEKFLKQANILCFEWGEKAGEIIELLKSKGQLVYVKMKYISEQTRSIEINS